MRVEILTAAATAIKQKAKAKIGIDFIFWTFSKEQQTLVWIIVSKGNQYLFESPSFHFSRRFLRGNSDVKANGSAVSKVDNMLVSISLQKF